MLSKKTKKKKKKGMTTNTFFKSPKYSTGAPIKMKKDNLIFFSRKTAVQGHVT